MAELPFTNYHLHTSNKLEMALAGRIKFERAHAMLHFTKKGMVQRILHEIKYKNNTELAIFMGEMYGGILAAAHVKVDGIVAVPLHASKLRQRGYNQAALIAQGVARIMKITDYSSFIKRKDATESQTKKARYARWENVKEVFTLTDAEVLSHKHLLICDDVITTGATIEALCNTLPESATVSIAALATPVLI